MIGRAAGWLAGWWSNINGMSIVYGHRAPGSAIKQDILLFSNQSMGIIRRWESGCGGKITTSTKAIELEPVFVIPKPNTRWLRRLEKHTDTRWHCLKLLRSLCLLDDHGMGPGQE